MKSYLSLMSLCLCLGFVSSSCSRETSFESEHAGTLTKIAGKFVVLDDQKAESVCANQYCEPNYIYYASFGRKRHHDDVTFGGSTINPPTSSPQNPAPSDPGVGGSYPQAPSRPTPSPTPYVGNIPNSENQDYSKSLLRLSEAWAISQGSRQVVVAVVDSGVQYTHPDLANNIWVNEAELNGIPGVDDDRNGYVDDVYGYDFSNNRPNAYDDNMHGTHCAGIIGSQLNGSGTFGVAPLVKIMPVKFLDANGAGSADNAIRAINYAVANGANIISASFGSTSYSQYLFEAIQNAVNQGVYFVAAAGNDTKNNDLSATYPANYPGVIAVASTDSADNLSYFSNYGQSFVYIAAPGSSIYSTVPTNAYNTLSGTSMAAPQVAGALALGLSLGKNVSMDVVKTKLCDSAHKILTNVTKCGRMDVYEFVNAMNHL